MWDFLAVPTAVYFLLNEVTFANYVNTCTYINNLKSGERKINCMQRSSRPCDTAYSVRKGLQDIQRFTGIIFHAAIRSIQWKTQLLPLTYTSNHINAQWLWIVVWAVIKGMSEIVLIMRNLKDTVFMCDEGAITMHVPSASSIFNHLNSFSEVKKKLVCNKDTKLHL